MKKILLIIVVFTLTNQLYTALPYVSGTGRRVTTNQSFSSDLETNARICAQQGYCGNIKAVDQFSSNPVEYYGKQYLECRCVDK